MGRIESEASGAGDANLERGGDELDVDRGDRAEEFAIDHELHGAAGNDAAAADLGDTGRRIPVEAGDHREIVGELAEAAGGEFHAFGLAVL